MPQLKTAPMEIETFDYVGSYERAIGDVVKACGSREAANQLLDALHKHYENTDFLLKKAKKEHWKDPEGHAQERRRILSNARFAVAAIIEAHVPHTGDHIKELILGTSLAVAAMMVPLTYAFSTLSAAAMILSVGGSYYIGYKLLRNWKAISGKERVAARSSTVSPKSVKGLSRIVASIKKK